jgi:hypothetical protein
MQILEHTTTIQAPPDTVWRVLTDTDAYGRWNPFITEFVGPLRVGQRVAVTIHAGKRSGPSVPPSSRSRLRTSSAGVGDWDRRGSSTVTTN